MDPQRPSTSKNQTHLKAGGSRSKMKKEVKELLCLAKDVKDELVFLQTHKYKKFKAKNHTIEIQEIGPIWGNFLHELSELKFHKECIYWCTKILEDVRLCDSTERSIANWVIVRSFYGLDDYENVLKYGEKYLAISMQTNTSDERTLRESYLCIMKQASRKLNRMQDELQYLKEILKLTVVQYNAKEIEKRDLLRSYLNFIEMQTKMGDFKSAKKTLKHLRMFSLNSMNSRETINAMENEDYGKIFPLNNLLSNSEVKDKKKLEADFCNKNSSDNDIFQPKVDLYWLIGQICWQKHEILMSLDEVPINLEWGYLALNIHHDINLHLGLLDRTSEEIAAKLNGSMIEITGVTLLLADKDQINRHKLFSQLKKKMCGVENQYIFKIISFAQRGFSNLILQKVMPFLEFCLRSLNGGATSHEFNESKVQLSTFKNSLTIMNCFGDLKNTLAFQPKAFQPLLL